jgi:hypothetical protein
MGFVFDLNSEREELRTDETRYFEEGTIINGKFRAEVRNWNLLDYKQEQLDVSFEVGPMGGYGNWIDSTRIEETIADHNYYGLRTSAGIAYKNRYYYDPTNYTIVDVSAWGRFDVFKQNSDGTIISSLGNITDFDNTENRNRFRYGLQAKAGWGFGRLSPMNHLMTADYLIRKYYPGRNFSDAEIAQLAQFIASLKNRRSWQNKLNHQNELEQIEQFLKEKFVLSTPEDMASDWQYSEFTPRYHGQRFELGPYFKYYNREPDFVYGAYLKYDNAKFVDIKRNRNFSANMVYNRYKKQDWATAEINLGWSLFTKLKSQFDLGIKYIPGIEINGFEDVGPLSHNLVPYVGYYTQINKNSRVRFDFAWRFADGEQFLLPGPEFSLAFYRSRY